MDYSIFLEQFSNNDQLSTASPFIFNKFSVFII